MPTLHRFLSADRLPCNCGATSCCGLVNESGASDQHEMAPRMQLKPWRKAAQKC